MNKKQIKSLIDSDTMNIIYADENGCKEWAVRREIRKGRISLGKEDIRISKIKKETTA